MKTCIKCGVTKELSLFHKHKRMKDGHLNKCATCVVESVAEWRKQNPESRAQEHARKREKLGFKTRQEYFTERAKKAKGRQVSKLQYSHKRRVQTNRYTFTELDELVFLEAINVRNRRKEITGIDWHIDHIVPINHKLACGLHNGFNLQVVPAAWNVKKQATNMNTYFTAGY